MLKQNSKVNLFEIFRLDETHSDSRFLVNRFVLTNVIISCCAVYSINSVNFYPLPSIHLEFSLKRKFFPFVDNEEQIRFDKCYRSTSHDIFN